jgi:hypothetical protein
MDTIRASRAWRLRNTLRLRQSDSQELGRTIQRSRGRERWDAWEEKRSYGRDTRPLLLAYGFLRGVPYLACERKCAEDNPPSIEAIIIAASEHGIELSRQELEAWTAATTEAGTTLAAE